MFMKNGITVRSAEKEDVRQIAEILVEDWQKAYRGIMDDTFLDSMSVDQRYEIEVTIAPPVFPNRYGTVSDMHRMS